MSEWAVVGVLATFLTIIGTITTPIVKLNSTISELSTKIEMFGRDKDKLEADIKDLETKNRETHTDLYNKFNGNTMQLTDHETRINHLEDNGK